MQRYAREMLAALDIIIGQRADLEAILLTPPLRGNPRPALENITLHEVGGRAGHAWEQVVLPRHVPREAVLFCPGNTAPIVSLLGHGRVLVTVHDLSYRYFPEAYSRRFRMLYAALIPLILRKANRVVTVSNSEKRAIMQHYPFVGERLVAIQNGGLPVGVAPQKPIAGEQEQVLYVGSLSRRKNFPAMLRVAVKMARTRDVRFVFAGSVPAGLTDSLAEIPADVKGAIVFLGQVDNWDRLLSEFRSASCFLFPSFYEASPLPPIEAMGCGCPVVVGDIPSLVERCGQAAYYCDPDDDDSIAEAVADVLDDPDLSGRLRIAGYARADEYSWMNCAKATLEQMLALD